MRFTSEAHTVVRNLRLRLRKLGVQGLGSNFHVSEATKHHFASTPRPVLVGWLGPEGIVAQ